MIYSDLIDENITESADNGVLGQLEEKGSFGYKLFKYTITDDKMACKIQKQKGTYLTININPTFHNFQKAKTYLINKLAKSLQTLINFKKKNPYILVIGLGNAFIMADSLGAKIVKNLFTTHTLPKSLKNDLGDLSALIPGVSGINSIPTFEIVKSIVDSQKPDIVICIDALTAKNYKRIGCSFQISNTSLTPGAGVGNTNQTLSKSTLGVEVVTIGVPLMINAKNFNELNNLPNFIVTPKDIDIIVSSCANVVSNAINQAVHKQNYKNFY